MVATMPAPHVYTPSSPRGACSCPTGPQATNIYMSAHHHPFRLPQRRLHAKKCTSGRLPSICRSLAVADGAQEELGFFAHVVVCARLQDSQQFFLNAHNYM